jgi:hypothetical protein
MPPAHRYSICAPADISIKEFYKDYFEEVFLFFHPFVKVKTKELAERLKTGPLPTKQQLIEGGELVSWKEAVQISGLTSYAEMDIALRTWISGLRKDLENQEFLTKVMNACLAHNWVEPGGGGMLPAFIINDILYAIQKEGHDWLWVGDEHGTERKLEWIGDLVEQDNLFRNNLFTHDVSLLVTTHWDSDFSFLCGSKETVERIVKTARLEGFYCDKKTEIYWSVKN